MILRRVIKHFREQEWTAIFLDFLIVVVGVFVGLQVSNWNDDRLREKTEQVYIERIREDLSANIEDFKQRIAYYNQARTNGLAALTALDDPPEKTGVQFLVDVYQASQALPREMGRDTYDEILSAGGTSAISNAVVRKKLTNFYRSMTASTARMQYIPPYRDTIRKLLPYRAQTAIRAACNDVISTGKNNEAKITLPENCQPILAPVETSQAIRIVLEQDIRQDLNRLLSDLDNKLSAAQLIIDRVELLDKYLEAQYP